MKFIVLAILAVSFQAKAADLQTVPYVDVQRYVGSWFNIARNPLPFEDGCVCSLQKLSIATDGIVNVTNTCNDKSVDGPARSIVGTATNDDPKTNARFTVDFGLPKKGQYWIIGLDSEYRFAVVSEPTRRALYILSKTPQLAPDLYDEALRLAASQVSTDKLVKTQQAGCKYP